MKRVRDRGSRRRDFGEDDYQPPDWSPAPSSRSLPGRFTAPDTASVEAHVKWFAAAKGFGFVELGDGSGDAFLPAAVLEAAGLQTIDPGTKLSVQVRPGNKGRQVTAVISIDASPAQPKSASQRRGRPDSATARTVEGIVKFYNTQKGFGFVVCDDGEKDVFVHASVLERAGLGNLAEGTRLSMQVVDAPKGREAINVTILNG